MQATKSVVIVGGGTAGWLTAGTLAATLKPHENGAVSVTLVESPNVPIIGVGEGTWPTMRKTLDTLGIRETDFIRECNVSFKQGAKFSQWVTGAKDDYYYHPLVLPQESSQFNLAPHWQAYRDQVSFSRAVAPQEHLCEQGLAPKQITTPEYQAVANYAYHLDAGAFAAFLQKHCVNTLGVRHVLADVEQVHSDNKGDISHVSTPQAGAIYGDLFVDCTGFKSLLLGQHLQVPFKSCRDVLFLDRALAVHVPYESEHSAIASHTLSTAQTAGWVWDIGLSTRRGVGHVYSSDYIDDDLAQQQLHDYLAPSVPDPSALSYRKIEIKPGHRTVFWKNNCVAVGLSAGFLEPLEASALLLVEISARAIADQFPANRVAMEVIAKRFNETFRYRWDRIIDFLKLHYMLSKREDSPFWLANRDAATIPESLQELLTLWQYHYPWHNDFDRAVEVFPAESYQYILYGMGFYTQGRQGDVSRSCRVRAHELFEKNQQQAQKMASMLPTNRELLQKIHQYGMQRI